MNDPTLGSGSALRVGSFTGSNEGAGSGRLNWGEVVTPMNGDAAFCSITGPALRPRRPSEAS